MDPARVQGVSERTKESGCGHISGLFDGRHSSGPGLDGNARACVSDHPDGLVIMGLDVQQSGQAPVRPVRHQIVFTLSNHWWEVSNSVWLFWFAH